MRLKFEFLLSSAMCRVAAAGLLAGALGACSTDVARFSDNPFGNPFKAGASGSVDRTSTGSVRRQASQVQETVTAAPALGRVTSQPLAAPAMAGVKAPIAPMAATATATATATAAAASRLPSRAPSAVDLASTGSVTPRAVAGWSAAGGTPVVMASGENVNTLATRYGVPASAILAANGLSSSSQLTPGSRVTIPVYNASAPASPRVQAPVAAPVAAAVTEPPVVPSTVTPPAPRIAATPRPPQPVAVMSQRSADIPPARVSAPARPPVPTPAPRPAVAAAPVARSSEPARIVPPAQVAAPKVVASASADAAREKAKLQADAAKARAETARQQSAASSRADAEVAARKAAEAKAKAEAERARLAEMRARTAEDRAKAAEASKEAEANRIKAAEAKKKAEAERKVQAEAKAKADRELKAARVEAAAAERKAKAESQQPAARQPAAVAAVPAPQRQQVDPAPTSSVPKDEPRAATADFRWPARGRVISGFSGKGANEGINIAVPEGTPVKAAGDGVVAYSGNELKGYGNLVLIRHDNGYVSAYAHNGDITVRRGEKVSRGQTIAKSGQSGNVSSPQLHFEIRKGSTPVDPMPYLAN